MHNIKDAGVYLQVWMTQEQVLKIPVGMVNDTCTGADFMILGNEKEIMIVNNILQTDLSVYCFDYILINIEE